MQLRNDKRQKNQLALAFTDEIRSEAPRVSAEGTESFVAKHKAESPAIGEQWMEEVCERENCKQALARVKANKGSPGVDGITVHDLPGYLRRHGPAIREQLLKKRSAIHRYQAQAQSERTEECGGRAMGAEVSRIQLHECGGSRRKRWFASKSESEN